MEREMLQEEALECLTEYCRLATAFGTWGTFHHPRATELPMCFGMTGWKNDVLKIEDAPKRKKIRVNGSQMLKRILRQSHPCHYIFTQQPCEVV